MIRFVNATAAVTATIAVIGAPPILLAGLIGNPWPPEGVALSAPLTDGAIIGLLAVVVWVLWAQLVWCIVAETIAALTADRLIVSTRFTFSAQKHLARRLITTIVIATVAAPVITSLAAAHATGDDPAAATGGHPQTAASVGHRLADRPSLTEATGARSDRAQTPASAEAAATEVRTRTVTVMRLDSLWSIAERELGDAERWPEIAMLNEGAAMGDGHRFLTADHIRPGWTLRVPDDTAPQQRDLGAAHVVTVQPGDTLSGLASTHLGDAGAYRQIFNASRSINQPDNQHLTDVDEIEVGWTLRVRSEAPGPRSPGTARKPPPTPTEHPASDLPPQGASPHLGIEPGEAGTPGNGARHQVSEADSPRPPEAAGRSGDDPEAEENSADQPPWMLAGLTGAGAVLGGALLLTYRLRRRDQARARTPGRTFLPIDPELVDVEKSIWTHQEAATTSADLHLLLRRLAAWSSLTRSPLPALAAAELDGRTVTLHLAAPHDMPTGWRQLYPDRLRWSIEMVEDNGDGGRDRGDMVGVVDVSAALGHVDAPYPLLVTVGATDAERTWLLNLEELADVVVRGDRPHAENFVRYLLAELTLNPWSGQARVWAAGIGAELGSVSPDRLTVLALDQSTDAISQLTKHAERTSSRAARLGGSPATGRSGQLDDDVWQANVLATTDTSTTLELRRVAREGRGSAATCVITIGSEVLGDGVEMLVNDAGRLHLPSFGLELSPVSLTSAEAAGCVALLAQAGLRADVPIPPHKTEDAQGQPYVDRAGAVLEEFGDDRAGLADDPERGRRSLLPEADQRYRDAAPITEEELQQLAPSLPDEVLNELRASDPTLDQDISDWFDPGCHRPRLCLLGPVSVKAYGKPLAKRKPYFTEMLTYLAVRRRHGVTPVELADAFNIEVRKARIYVNTIRDWLGLDPVTGEPYLPHADKAPYAGVTGVPVYQVSEQLQIDSELLIRLRARGQARGAAGLEDFDRALRLVTGPPFSALRAGGWSWLLDGERLDLYAAHAVADVAHIVAAKALADEDAAGAHRAVAVLRRAVPDEEATVILTARVLALSGEHVAAAELLRRAVIDRADTDDGPVEPTARSAAMIKEGEILRLRA